MSWKFFKLTIGKIILLVILIVLVSFIPQKVEICSMGPNGVVCSDRDSDFHIGYPGFYGDIGTGSDAIAYGFSLLNFLINIIIGYILSCLIILIYSKIKKKKVKRKK